MAQIQRSTVELDKQNFISRIFNAKNDKETIAAWGADLGRILHVFEARSTVHSSATLLTVHLQTELALHTHVAVSNIREDVANTRELVSDIHRTMLKDQEGADTRNQTVGNHDVLSMILKFLQLPRLEPGSISTGVVDRGTLLLSQKYSENRLRLRQEPALDGTS